MSQHGGGGATLPGWLESQFSRRAMIAGGGLVVSGATLAAAPGGRHVVDALLQLDAAPMPERTAATGVLVERMRRASDQLVLDVALINMALIEPDRGTPYVVPLSGKTGYLWVVLPGQNIGEEVRYVETPQVAQGELAFPSVLVFEVGAKTKIPYTIAGMLSWGALKPLWSTASGDITSVLEAPYRLLVQPNPLAKWQHESEPKTRTTETSGPATELWHTRLTGRDPNGFLDPRGYVGKKLRAVADYKTPLATSLDSFDRDQIVKQSKDSDGPHAPVDVTHLMLSSRGALLELHGAWDSPASLASWDHRAAWGRDNYVKVAYRGYLAPYGHKALVIEEVVRRFESDGSVAAAHLERTQTLVIVEPDVDTSVFSDRYLGGVERGCRFPFKKVTCTAKASPPVFPLGTLKKNGGRPYTDPNLSQPLVLPFVGTDWEGRQSAFTSQVAFVPIANGTVDVTKLSFDVDLLGQQVAISPEPDDRPGCMTLPLHAMTITSKYLLASALGDLGRAPFRPISKTFTATVPAVQVLSGGSPIQHGYHPAYLDDAKNKGGVVAAPTGEPGLSIDGQLTGGLAQLPSAYQGLSTKAGAVIGNAKDAIDDLAKGATDPAKVFDAVKLLGCISLSDIITKVGAGADDLAQTLDNIPNALTELANGRQTLTLRMQPKLQRMPKSGDGPIVFIPGSLVLTSIMATGGGQPAEATLDVRLSDAKLQLADMVVLPIKELRVTSGSGTPFDLSLTLGTVQFLGPLAFVQDLCVLISPFLGGGSSKALTGGPAVARSAAGASEIPVPDVDVTSEGIVVTEAVSLPNVALGAFSLTGLGFGLELVLGFTGDLTVRVNFATHEDPFQITYLAVGGGGYVALELFQGEVRQLEISLQVCGALGFDLVVAAGALEIAAGFILILPLGDDLTVKAFLRATGSLDVLGLINISVVFELVLAYHDGSPSTLTGSATLELKVEVLFFSKTVSATMSKTIAGGNSGTPVASKAALGAAATGGNDAPPLTFADAYPDQGTWDDYVDAFLHLAV